MYAIRQVIRAAAAMLLVTAAAHADTFRIEIDYMDDPGDGHDHQPVQLVLDAVVQMFACQGHTLILDLDDAVPHQPTLIGDPTADCGSFWTYTGAANTYRSIRDAWFDREGQAGWHYCIFAHDYSVDANPGAPNSGCSVSGSSGRANGGDSLIVTLGSFDGQTGSLFAQAATLAHEFGHNLGLNHCGGQVCGSNNTPTADPNWVGPQMPNLPSVMSYNYQLAGVRTRLLSNGLIFEESLFKEMDYSHGRMCTWNENSLDETVGSVMMPIDFNCDNDADDAPVVQDLNFGGAGVGNTAPWCGPNQRQTLIADFDEWSNIQDGATLVASAGRGAGDALFLLEQRERESSPCITSEEWQRVSADLGLRGGGPPLVEESCITAENVFVGFSAGSGVCDSPYDGVQAAQESSPNGSVYYLYRGTYNEAGSTLLDKRGKYFCKTGSALIR